MGIFEGAVVVYLNRLQYLGELASLSDPRASRLILTEVIREAASIGMIVSVACLTARGLIPRLAQTAVIFGIWDIVYYIFLRWAIGFPATPLTWDVLFLIPGPWLGPVLAPILVSLALIVGGWSTLLREAAGRGPRPGVSHWALAIAGGLVVIASFMMDAPADFNGFNFPVRFRWEVFLSGLAMSTVAFALAMRRGERVSAGR